MRRVGELTEGIEWRGGKIVRFNVFWIRGWYLWALRPRMNYIEQKKKNKIVMGERFWLSDVMLIISRVEKGYRMRIS